MTDSGYADADYVALCERYSTRGRWGQGDPAGALNRLDRHTVLAALGLVSEGTVVSLGGPARLVEDESEVVSGAPSGATLQQWYDCAQDWAATNDRFSTDIHGARSQTHIDFPHHFFQAEENYLGWDRRRTRAEFGVDPSTAGVVTRGVLVDIAAHNGGPLPNRAVRLDELEAVLAAQGTELHPGDAVIVNCGIDTTAENRLELGDAPGLHIECAERILAAEPALVGSDLGTDASPSPVPGCLVPWHLLLLVHAGIRLLDGLQLADLSAACRDRSRYEFALVVSPLKIPGASGSPLNPLAIF